MRLFTIGSTKKTAASFFEILGDAGVARVIDVRLNNRSQLSGFAKAHDLAYFLDRLCGIAYTHALLLAPTRQLLDDYRKPDGTWDDYERGFLELMRAREVEDPHTFEIRDRDCLLCSEEAPHHCHRRLVAEYLAARHPAIGIHHLGQGRPPPAIARHHSLGSSTTTGMSRPARRW